MSRRTICRAILILVALTLAACTPAQMRLFDERHGFTPGHTETVVASIEAQRADEWAAARYVAATRPSTPAAIIRDVFGAEGNRAVRVAQCESGLDPGAVSPTNDHGIFQINRPTWNKPGHHDPVADWIGRNWGTVYDPAVNAEMAWRIYSNYGWSMWACGGA